MWGAVAAFAIVEWRYWTYESWVELLSFIVLFFGGLIAFVLLVLLIPPPRFRLRRAAKNLLFFDIGLLVPVFLGAVVLNDLARELAFRNLFAHARPVIEALEVFQAENGMPAAALDQLVPAFMAQLPEPAYRVCHQDYQLVDFVADATADPGGANGSGSRDGVSGWQYTIQCPLDWFFSTETLVYRSDGDYEKVSRYGTPEPIGDWMYYYFVD
jgi:hypothetical protein